MNDKTFKNQYKHPLWQKKRLEVLESHEYRCQFCGDGDSELHVHHLRYVSGRNVWEYDLDELSCLCESCHKYIHEIKADYDLIFQQWLVFDFYQMALLKLFDEGFYGAEHMHKFNPTFPR